MMPFFASELRLKASWTLLLAISQIAGVVAQNCVPPPISLPIKNVTLSTGKTQRGVFLTVAEPEQNFAFLPYWRVNNTFLYGPACDSLNLSWEGDSCVTFRGGVYKPADSTTKGAPPSSFKPPMEA
ncbi:hypothetical protein J3459_017702 [Metarhizium acridum]|nr:hypothetical protein J3459_017702 [Metarhizium acridum]KAG8412582.1 hypothetical protein J3458_014292 [Metarhizium acridum]